MKQLLLLFVFVMCGVFSYAQTKINGIYYNLNNRDYTATVTYQNDGSWGDNGRNTAMNTQEYREDIVIPETVTSRGTTYTVTGIGEYAFYGNNSLNSITIPKTVTTIGDYAMSWCAGLTEIIVAQDNKNFCSEDGVLFTKDMKTLIQYPEDKKDPSYVIPNGVEVLGPDAFQGCNNLASVTIPEGIKNLRDYVFQDCQKLTSITLPSSLTNIEQKAFNECYNLKNITFLSPNPPTIKNDSFNGVSDVTVNVPQGSEEEYAKLGIGGNSGSISSNPYKITVEVPAGEGAAEGSGLYKYNQEVTLRVIPNTGYFFKQWQDGNTENPRTIVVKGNASYKATLEKGSYTITVVADGQGSVTGKGSYKYGDKATLTAIPVTGYKFVKWQDGNTQNPREITVTKNETYTATFAIGTYTLTVTSNGNGTVSGGGTYDYGKKVTIKATADANYHFVKWSDGNTNATREVTVKDDATYTATFAINQHTLTVTSNGNGTVTGGGTYDYGKKVTIKATADANYHFVKWSDGNTNATREVTVKGDATYTATFAINQHTLTVTSNGNGTVTGGGTYDYGKKVTIKATADANYHFVKWSDGNTNATREVTVKDDATYTATFAINQHTLTVTSNGNGTVSGGGTYDYGKKVTIKATADANYHFVKWSDGNTNATREVTVKGDATYTATFAINQHTLTVTSNGNGTVTGGGTYDYGKKVTLKATADVNYHFVKWNDGDTNATREVTVKGDATYTATFAINQHTLTVTSNGNGTVSGGGTYDYGKKVTIKATADANYHFVKWNDGNTNATREVTVKGDATYTATFAINQHTLTVTSNGNGTVTGGGTYDYGKKVTIKATADVNYHFVKWNDGDTNATREVTVKGDATYTATFAINTHTFTLNVGNGGTVAVAGKANSDGTYNAGSVVTLTATPDEHYHFKQWSTGVTAATYNVTIKGDTEIDATFEINSYNISVSGGSQGTVSGGGTYPYGTKVTFTANANTGNEFVSWSDGNTDNPREIEVTADASYLATFTIKEYTLTLEANGNGTVNGAGSYPYGTEVVIEAVADEHNTFEKWTDGVATAKRTVVVTSDITYTAKFTKNRYTIVVEKEGNGVVSKGGTYIYGKELTLTATPAVNHHFVQWSDGNTEAERTITVEGNVTYTAIFAINQFEVSAIVEGQGTVEGVGTYDYNSEVVLTAVPAENYIFIQWSDGVTTAERTVIVEADTEYTAIFGKEMISVVAYSANDLGTVEGGDNMLVAYGSLVTINAIPFEGAKFVCWNDGETSPNRLISAIEDIELIAYFEETGVQTGIDQLEDNVISIKVVGNAVVVDGTDEFAVYDLRGMRYYQTDNLPRGMFIVVTDKLTKKVYIK